MKRILVTGFFALLFSHTAFSQNETDALRYSRIGFGGTARYTSMGGAFLALGGDISSLSTNPAGIAVYRRNEMALTPSLFVNNVKSVYNGTTSPDSRYNMRIDNFGFIFSSKTQNQTAKGWQTIGFGLAYNRYSSFQSNATMVGQATSSLMDSWRRTAAGTGPYNLDAFNEGLGWNCWLLNNAIGDTTKYTDTIPDGDLLDQRKIQTVRGGMGEWLFSLGGNYSDKLFIGATISIPTLKYSEVTQYSEVEVHDTVSDFNSFILNQSLETKGRGISFKMGIIFRPVDFIRVAFAFHSPVSLRLNDTYSADMTSYVGTSTFSYASPTGLYNYSIKTPMRALAGIAFILGKTGIISIDYEFIDYSEAFLKAEDFNFITANNAIRDKYRATSNIRVGGEFRLLPWVFRAGFAFYGSPYQETVNNDASRRYFTGGVGYRPNDEDFYFDFGFVYSNEKSNYYFYDQSLVNPVENNWKATNVVMTLGYRF
jgi:Outer membrane protein transport protein (OMPP1/FadL/TodX)